MTLLYLYVKLGYCRRYIDVVVMVEATGMEPQCGISKTESIACVLRVGQTRPRQASIAILGPRASKISKTGTPNEQRT